MGVIFALGIGGAVLFMVRGCASNISPEAANIVLEKSGKSYLYSSLGSSLVKMSIEKGESPAAITCIQVYKDGDTYFVAPNNMKTLIDVMANNVEVHEYKEASYEGYVTSAENEAYSLESKFRSTKTIGQQITVFSVSAKKEDGATLDIEWSFNPKTGDYFGTKNCEVKSFWIQTNPSPGETVISSKDFLVIGLDKLSKFFSRKVEYDEETQVLFVKE